MGHRMSSHHKDSHEGNQNGSSKRGGHSRSKHGGKETHRLLSAEHFGGIVKIQLNKAQMRFKDKFFGCVSLGEQTFRTLTSIQYVCTDRPEWKSEVKIALEANGPRIVHVSVFETNRLSKSNLVGYCEIDLSEVVDHTQETFNLYDPSTKTKIVGDIELVFNIQDQFETEKSFARRLLSIVDYDDNGELSLLEFRDLLKAFGNKMLDQELEDLFKKADENKDGNVSADELASLLAIHAQKTHLINQCPVCGEDIRKLDALNSMVHLSLCFDEGSGNETMTGGFLTEKQATYGWLFKISEWVNVSTYDVGLKSGANAGHILVFDRSTKRLVEEVIDSKIVLSMRAIYQSKFGLALLDSGTRNLLLNLSEKQGKKMNSPESAADIPKFINFFQDQVNMDELKYPIDHYKTFNEFFTRELKPGSRPVAHEEDDAIAVCGADSRLMVFNRPDDATRFWIKGRKFSIGGLLGDEKLASDFDGGPMVIFRLAPQDYHRFHMPISGIVGKLVEIPGHLYTVNPIAVNSKYCNVFTENKRVICVISSREFGKMAFVAIGATMVGSITFSKKEGDKVKKGEEFGYFSFGGSTCICVFQKHTIDLDDDLVANSERSLETLVSVGMTLGTARHIQANDLYLARRPTIKDSVVGLDNQIAIEGISVTDSVNVPEGGFGP
ncbi:hypothetical protein O6H91_05G071300 [Diphasiastrum complanatum]|uniref:Uncharacterized protein n=1 Tax=Diphasiastrum complanatum TaxID=34168 RepID=A0ACC2DPA7_DIPCM|nr:hypothetical protein O6H91_05G071300 [Diphasiastrum complanatum]